jgi:spore maturation protein CgeB
VHYCPQGAPLREPVEIPDAPRVVFVGDLANSTYHVGRRAICNALEARVLNARERSARLAIEAQMPALYRSSRYCLSASPLAPGYTSVRTYSILACGGLMPLHRFPGAERLFTHGENALLFDTAEEARQLTRELDDQPEERARIAENGRRLHAERHTVAHRIVSLCRQVTGVDTEFTGWLS